MGQRRRHDGPGVRHHVMNRGIGKRMILATREDCRLFLAQTARAHRRGQLELEAYALLGTHFHLLVRTSNGTLSEAMRRVSNGFVRWFNRRNRRDGPLLRGRFRSKPVRSTAYLRTLLRYIDHNAVKARLCEHPSQWPWGSARYYLGESAPRWLVTSHVHSLLDKSRRSGESRSGAYARLVSPTLRESERELVETRVSAAAHGNDVLDDLIDASTARMREWLVAKARNADGLRPSLAMAAASAIETAVARTRAHLELPLVNPDRKRTNAWLIMTAGLQFSLSGLGCRALALRHDVSIDTASRRVRNYRKLMLESAGFARAASSVARRALAETHPQ